MKDVDESTIGGRIRRARTKCKLTTSELGKAVGVSQNYISVVERNDKKQASPVLLRKIAEVTGVSVAWLKDGGPDAADATHFEDIRLLLTIIMQEERNLTKETIASVLAVDTGTVDRILSGEAEYDPQWEPGISNLVQRLDLPALCKKLRALDALLQQEAEKKDNAKLSWSFRKAISKMRKCSFWLVGRPARIQDEPECTMYVLQGEDGMEKWSIQYYSSALDYEEAEEALKRAIDLSQNDMAMTCVAAAFSDKESYDSCCGQYNSIIGDYDAALTLDGSFFRPIPEVLLLLVDRDSGDVLEINDLYSDYNRGHEGDF